MSNPLPARLVALVPLAVLLLYWTVAFDADGETVFKQDIYDRDAAIISTISLIISMSGILT